MTLWSILLAGGSGQRMGMSTPKQFLSLAGKPIALHSFEVLLSHPAIEGLVVVCAEEYRHLFQGEKEIHFAPPGYERCLSVKSGLQMIPQQTSYLCIHDAARPFITKEMIDNSYAAAKEHGAAAIGIPVKATIKVCDEKKNILHQPDRSTLWEMQTPQILRRDIMEAGFQKIEQDNMLITDDVALAELLGYKAQVVSGCYKNIKITTPEDLDIAEVFIRNHV